MKTLDISKYKLFEPILDFKIGADYIDLHNDFNCIEIKADMQNVILYFLSLSDYNKKVEIKFNNAKIVKTKYELNDKTKYTTLCNFHRGKFENLNHTLYEKNEDGQKYYYLDFFEGQHLEIFAKKAIASPVERND